MSDEHKKKISNSRKGISAWNKGLKGIRGNKHPNWKGGKRIHMGYIYDRIDETPLTKWNGYVKRANLVWFENTGEIIKKPYCLHHINHNRLDDRFENLEKMELWRHIAEQGLRNARDKKGRFTK